MPEMRHLLSCVAATLAVAATLPSSAEMVAVQWDAEGIFAREVLVAPSRFVEVCEKLPQGMRIAWRFESQAALDFNIHYHEGKAVRFPAKRDRVRVADGVLDAAIAQDYCWMWTNRGDAPARLNLTLKRL